MTTTYLRHSYESLPVEELVKKNFYSVSVGDTGLGIVCARDEREALAFGAMRGYPKAFDSEEDWNAYFRKAKAVDVTAKAVRYLNLCKLKHESLGDFWDVGTPLSWWYNLDIALLARGETSLAS